MIGAAFALCMGLNVSDAVRFLLTRTANEGAPPLELIGNAAAHDAWFRSKVQEVIDDKRPDIAHEDVEARFTARREGSLRKSAKLPSQPRIVIRRAGHHQHCF
jgi:DNA-damage-inducible protein J